MEKLLSLIKATILLFLLNSKSFAQTFEFSEKYIEAPLIFSNETTLEGISKIVPVGGDFSKYSKIELSKVKNDIIEPVAWLKDKIYDETGEIVELENTLRSQDSPLSDPIFDQFKHLPMYIDNTIENKIFVFGAIRGCFLLCQTHTSIKHDPNDTILL